MFQLKRITAEAIPGALEKALRYRLLNEPLEAESICRDVLGIDPNNQQAVATLVLSLTDQFGRGYGAAWEAARAALAQLAGEYERAYYEGIVHERWAKAQLAKGMPAEAAIDWFLQAMRCYERADAVRPGDDPDAALRWNTCARFLERQPQFLQSNETLLTDPEAGFGGDVPDR
jgi:hypothetical protein